MFISLKLNEDDWVLIRVADIQRVEANPTGKVTVITEVRNYYVEETYQSILARLSWAPAQTVIA